MSSLTKTHVCISKVIIHDNNKLARQLQLPWSVRCIPWLIPSLVGGKMNDENQSVFMACHLCSWSEVCERHKVESEGQFGAGVLSNSLLRAVTNFTDRIFNTSFETFLHVWPNHYLTLISPLFICRVKVCGTNTHTHTQIHTCMHALSLSRTHSHFPPQALFWGWVWVRAFILLT